MDNIKKRYWAAIGICTGVFSVAMDWSVVNNSLPSIQRSLGTSLGELQWIMNAFGLAMTISLVTMGRLGDIIGRRRLYYIGLIIFGLSSIGAAISPSAIFLIVNRCFQGLSMAIMMPCSQSLITHAFPEELHGKALGIWMTIMGIGISIGPVVGGIVVTLLSWHWIFYLNLPFVIVSLILIKIFVQESRNESQTPKFDIPGVILLTIALGSFVIALVQAPTWDWNTPIFWGLLGTSVLGFIAFFFAEHRAEAPLVQFEFFNNRQFFAGSLGAYSIAFLFWGVFFLVPLYLQNVRGLSPAGSGLMLISQTIPFAILSHYAGTISHRVGTKVLVKVGALISALGVLLMTFYTITTPLVLVGIALGLFGIGGGLMFGPTTSLGISALPRSSSGLAAGAVTTMQEIGSAMGLTLVGTVFRSQEKAALSENLLNENIQLPPVTIEKIRSLMSSYDHLKQEILRFPSPTQKKIITAFQQSFVDGFAWGMWLCVFIATVSLVLILFTLKKTKKMDRSPVHQKD
jgi:EmrB/QacA subfamily drug resistance transporter